jgi:hypothetical protein
MNKCNRNKMSEPPHMKMKRLDINKIFGFLDPYYPSKSPH